MGRLERFIVMLYHIMKSGGGNGNPLCKFKLVLFDSNVVTVLIQNADESAPDPAAVDAPESA